MMEEGQESRFVCKLCYKRYPCGKSLGSHEVSFSEYHERVKLGEFGNGQSSYGLRENPKKTWRAVDSRLPLPQERVCKQCGKGFQSLKALCGHMACHSEKDRALKDDHSWTSESQKLVLDSHSDTEAEERRLRTRSSSKSKRNKKLVDRGNSYVFDVVIKGFWDKGGVNSVVESSDNNSVVLEAKSSSIEMRIGKKESLDCIRNRDEMIPTTTKTGNKKLKDSTIDAEIAQMENSDSGYFLDECAKVESDVSVDGFRRFGGFSECKKPIMSVEERDEEYGAGFRKGLKVIRTELSKSRKENEYDDDGMASNFAGIESRKRKYNSESPEPWNESAKIMKSRTPNAELCDSSPREIVESPSSRKSSSKNSSRYTEKTLKPKKNKGHVCPFCHRVFKNGQALGGHKRSHFIGGHDENNNRSAVAKPEAPDLLDLNLPAPRKMRITRVASSFHDARVCDSKMEDSKLHNAFPCFYQRRYYTAVFCYRYRKQTSPCHLCFIPFSREYAAIRADSKLVFCSFEAYLKGFL
ncbi:hypothetical protein Sango_1050500 [Sesamum angolense]|uniref:C2H2-type domain-containing protein n=1 Tax=Sesamum angolense TaxID=2727404 RepID=A0AAE2BZ44_9LAMI|nr:hypothetical protein Sango_1050500 [Sesamum angolense]